MWVPPRWLNTEKDLARLRGRVEALESRPVPPDLGGDVRSTTLSLGALRTELGSQREDLHATSAQLGSFEANLEQMRAKVERWTAAIAEGIERTERSERRIRSTVERARKELKSLGYTHEGLDAEDAQLRLVDGAAGEVKGVSDVPEGLEGDADAPSSVPGVTLGQLRRARGMQ